MIQSIVSNVSMSAMWRLYACQMSSAITLNSRWSFSRPTCRQPLLGIVTSYIKIVNMKTKIATDRIKILQNNHTDSWLQPCPSIGRRASLRNPYAIPWYRWYLCFKRGPETGVAREFLNVSSCESLPGSQVFLAFQIQSKGLLKEFLSSLLWWYRWRWWQPHQVLLQGF